MSISSGAALRKASAVWAAQLHLARRASGRGTGRVPVNMDGVDDTALKGRARGRGKIEGVDPTWTDVRTALAARAPAQVTDPPSSRAAVALILRDGPQGIEVLFIRRAEHPQDPWSGQMAFPGGRAEPG